MELLFILQKVFIALALVGWCSSFGMDFYNESSNGGQNGVIVLAMRIAVAFVLFVVLLCSRDLMFVNWIQVGTCLCVICWRKWRNVF